LSSVLGALDESVRMSRVIGVVEDPLLRGGGEATGPPLIIGSFVEVLIQGRSLNDVVRLERRHLRKGDTVWTMVEGKLSIREVEVVAQDESYAYLGAGVEAGEHIVTTNLSTPVHGADLRTAEEAPAAPDAESAR
jgi:hypothetical protein